MTYHLAIDIGASSGRTILGWVENKKLKLQEVYRFENYIKKENGALVWDIKHLVKEVVKGIAKCHEIGKTEKEDVRTQSNEKQRGKRTCKLSKAQTGNY